MHVYAVAGLLPSSGSCAYCYNDLALCCCSWRLGMRPRHGPVSQPITQEILHTIAQHSHPPSPTPDIPSDVRKAQPTSDIPSDVRIAHPTPPARPSTLRAAGRSSSAPRRPGLAQLRLRGGLAAPLAALA